MNNAKRRLEKLEQHNAVKDESGLRTITYLSYYETDSVPDVFDRPLVDWELLKRAADNKGLPSIITVDPYAEESLRGGDLPLCPASRYAEWKVQQNEQLRPQSTLEIVRYAPCPSNENIGQNYTKSDVLR